MSNSQMLIRLGNIGDLDGRLRSHAMKYLCLIFVDEAQFDSLPKIEQDSYVNKHFAFNDELREGGYFIVAQALQSIETAVTIRVSNGKVSVTDGPFAETKEQLRGFYLIEARDLNEAIRLASNIPSARLGSVEVRPILELNPPQKSVAQ
jgi:hypothetical protein